VNKISEMTTTPWGKICCNVNDSKEGKAMLSNETCGMNKTKL